MQNLRGILYVIVAAAFFGMMPIWVKQAYATGLTAIDFTFLRSGLAAIMLGVFIRYRKLHFRLSRQQIGPALVSAFSFTTTILLLYASYHYVSAGVATSLHYLFPVLVMLLAYFIYQEKLQLYKWIALLISIGGIYLIADPAGNSFSFKGVSLAILSAVTFAIYTLSLNHSQVKKVDSLVLAFYLCIFACFASLILLIVQGNDSFVITLKGLYYAGLVSFFCTSLALIFFIKGAQSIGSANASILSTLEPVVSLIAGIIILNEPLTPFIILGSLFIISAILLIGYADLRRDSLAKKKLKQLQRRKVS